VLVPSTALAADVSTDGFEIDYFASPGETNDVVVDQGAGSVTITESGAGLTLNDADGVGGCEVTGTVATCPEADVSFLLFTVDDGDDTVSLASTVTIFSAIEGEAGNDTLSAGGIDADLRGGEGDDALTGGDGQDFVDGGAGDDTIEGGSGDDFFDDGPGDDVINAGDGADEFFGNGGNDQFNGQGGDDYFNGFDFAGADTFSGGTGNDWLDYQRSRSVHVTLDDVADDGENCPGVACEGDNARSDIENLSGGRGDDTLIGNDGANVIAGEPGADTIGGLGGDHELLGDYGWTASPFGAGDDTIDGGTGNDRLFGDFGADSLTGGPGVDGLDGDAGNDALNSDDGGARDADYCGSGSDAVTGDSGDVVAGDCESVTGAIVGGPAGAPGTPGNVGAPGDPLVRVARVTRTARRLRVTAVSTMRGWVKVTVRRHGRVIATGRRWVQPGRRFTLTLTNRPHRRVRAGRFMLTTTLHPASGQVWTSSQRVRVR
jgi:Ca2+-binding RTX toxin-like protein